MGALVLGVLLAAGGGLASEVEPGTPADASERRPYRRVRSSRCCSPTHFRRVFCWGTLHDEETARRFSEIGVTDIRVGNTNQLALARRYGITPYCGTFSICDRLPGVQGVYFDYIGYSNFKGCYCEACLSAYRRQIEARGLPDTREQRDRFYLERLVDYYNAMVAHVKRRHPDFKSLWVKDAATLERELQAILAAGGDTLMVCNGNDMLAPGIFGVFKKYAAPPSRNRLRGGDVLSTHREPP